MSGSSSTEASNTPAASIKSPTVLPNSATTRTTTYTLRSMPVTTTSSYTVHPGKTVTAGPPASAFSFEDVKKYFEEQGKQFIEDPRTKHLVESGQATWEDVKKYVEGHTPNLQADEPKVMYTTRGGYIYPLLTHNTATVAAPNTLFEVGADSADIRNKICFRPRVDAHYDSTGNRIVLFFDLPGLEKKNVDIEVERGALSVSGDRAALHENTDLGTGSRDLIQERCFGYFYRKFQLPSNASEEAIKATMDKGILQISIGLTQTSPRTKKKIDVD